MEICMFFFWRSMVSLMYRSKRRSLLSYFLLYKNSSGRTIQLSGEVKWIPPSRRFYLIKRHAIPDFATLQTRESFQAAVFRGWVSDCSFVLPKDEPAFEFDVHTNIFSLLRCPLRLCFASPVGSGLAREKGRVRNRRKQTLVGKALLTLQRP